MKAFIISLESFQKGEIPEEVMQYINSCKTEPFIILDESSKIKTNNPCKESKKSKRTQAILKLNNIGHRCILTGTFMSKSPVNAYDQMNFLKRNFFPETMFAFAEHYTIRRSLPNTRGARIVINETDYKTIRKKLLKVKHDKYMLQGAIDSIHASYGVSAEDCIEILKHEEYTPFKFIDELWNRIGDNCMKVDRNYTVDMPPKVYKSIKLELTAEQKKLYLQLQNQNCTDNIVVDNGLKLFLRFQDICNGYEPIEHGDKVDEDGNIQHDVELVPLEVNPKLDLLEEIIEDLGEEQVVVWCSRTKLLYDAKERLDALGYKTGVYDGKIGTKQREDYYKAFSNKQIQILFCNQASASYGLDGLKECDYAIYLSNSYSVEHRVQSENRIYRGIVNRNKYIIDLTFEHTCEDRVVDALKIGKELLSTGETDTSLFLYTG